MKKGLDKFIFFDLDGTLVDTYKDPNWLKKIENEDVSLFEEAKPLIKQKHLLDLIEKLQDKGYKIGIISYLPWYASNRYKAEVKKAKEDYIKSKFSKINFDKIHIIPYGIPKDTFADKGDVLIDDDPKFRKAWSKGKAYTHEDLINKLKRIYKV